MLVLVSSECTYTRTPPGVSARGTGRVSCEPARTARKATGRDEKQGLRSRGRKALEKAIKTSPPFLYASQNLLEDGHLTRQSNPTAATWVVCLQQCFLRKTAVPVASKTALFSNPPKNPPLRMKNKTPKERKREKRGWPTKNRTSYDTTFAHRPCSLERMTAIASAPRMEHVLVSVFGHTRHQQTGNSRKWDTLEIFFPPVSTILREEKVTHIQYSDHRYLGERQRKAFRVRSLLQQHVRSRWPRRGAVAGSS